jgi:hypothetical protein
VFATVCAQNNKATRNVPRPSTARRIGWVRGRVRHPSGSLRDISAIAELDDLPEMLPDRDVMVVVNGWID